MLVEDTFQVDLPVDDAWRLLTDIERVVPCVPGARLDEVVDGEYRGRVSARIGPITVNYAGVARFVERDEVDHRAVISLRGQEERGNGSVNATVTTLLQPDGDRTRVDLATELDVSGRAAQFGRGILGDVASSVLGEFATQLEQMVAGTGNGRVEAGGAASPPRRLSRRERPSTCAGSCSSRCCGVPPFRSPASSSAASAAGWSDAPAGHPGADDFRESSSRPGSRPHPPAGDVISTASPASSGDGAA